MEDQLDTLSGSLTNILVQTGKILRNPLYHDYRYSDVAKTRVNEYLRPNTERFQDALTDIEHQILQAKAVMERDMSRIRKRRLERDREAGRIPPSPEKLLEAETGPLDSLEPSITAGTGEKQNEDAIMADAEILAGGNAADTLDIDNLSKVLGQDDTAGFFDNLPQDVAALDSPHTKTPNNELAPDPTNLPTDNVQAQTDASLPTITPADVPPNTDDFDFDTMFDNLEGMPQDTSMDLGLDLTSTDVGGMQSNILDSGGPMGSLDLGNLDTTNAGAPNTTNEDIDSLLPDLETLVDASNPNPSPNGTGLNTTPAPNNSGAAPGTSTAQQQPDQAAGANNIVAADPTAAAAVDASADQLNFDDLFGSTDLNMAEDNNAPTEGQDLLGDSLGEIQDFDDSWWNTEG